MNEPRYILEKYQGPGSRYTCPGCNQSKKFTRYIDLATGKHLHNDVGRCDREDSCGYHYTPHDYFNNGGKKGPGEFLPKKEIKKEPSYMDYSLVNGSMKSHRNNRLVKYIFSLSDSENVKKILTDYRIGTSKKYGGSAVFWQIDKNNMVRSGKIMGYNDEGKRVKNPKPQVTWVHSELKIKDFNLVQCFFGEHLISDKKVCIVESEKTAIIAALFLPDYTWIATGGKNGASWSNPDVFGSLKGKDVILFPDKGCEEDWYNKTARVKYLANISVSTILSKINIDSGDDLADFILNENGLTCANISTESHMEEKPRPPVALILSDVSDKLNKYGFKGLVAKEQAFIKNYMEEKNPAFKELVKRFELEYE